jgi:hypothetical protein
MSYDHGLDSQELRACDPHGDQPTDRLIPWNRVLLEKLMVRKVPAFYSARRFITTFKKTCHWTLS